MKRGADYAGVGTSAAKAFGERADLVSSERPPCHQTELECPFVLLAAQLGGDQREQRTVRGDELPTAGGDGAETVSGLRPP